MKAVSTIHRHKQTCTTAALFAGQRSVNVAMTTAAQEAVKIVHRLCLCLLATHVAAVRGLAQAIVQRVASLMRGCPPVERRIRGVVREQEFSNVFLGVFAQLAAQEPEPVILNVATLANLPVVHNA